MATAIAPADDGNARHDPLLRQRVPLGLLAEPLQLGEELHHEIVERFAPRVLDHSAQQVGVEPEVPLTWVGQVLSKMPTVKVDDRGLLGVPALQRT